jgi:acyl-CoA thioesterase
MIQAGKARLEVLGAWGDLSEPAGVDADISLSMPAMPLPEACTPRTGDLQGIELKLTDRLDVMLHPQQSVPGGADEPVLSGWIRLKDGSQPDTKSLLLFCDTFPPSPFGLLGIVGWVPTIELTVHVRRRPAPGWILGQFRTDDLQEGRMIESGCLWDSKGDLVAESRQIGLVLKKG